MKAQELVVDIHAKVSIPEETARRCLDLLEMWMDDNPDADIVCERFPLEDGGTKHKLSIKRGCDDGKEQIPGL